MGRGLKRLVQCPLCSGTQVSAEYRAADAVYLACEECRTVWPVEIPASEKPPEPRDTRREIKRAQRVV
jgi:uncharacterized Zn finger protein